MRITSVELKNFRCFPAVSLSFDNALVFIRGTNGKGKTSVLEALHYACYLRSFRTHRLNELIRQSSEQGIIALSVESFNSIDQVSIQLQSSKRAVKLNQKQIRSYKELATIYKVVTITEEDLLLISGSPSERRSFLDQILLLFDPEYATTMRNYQKILENRNALLTQRGSQESYHIWTDQLFSYAHKIAAVRVEALQHLEEQIQIIIKELHLAHEITLAYTHSLSYNKAGSYQEFLADHPSLMHQEMHYGRSLFGTHLDDFKIIFQEKSSRIYASRGQQKLILFLLKIAQLRTLKKRQQLHEAAIFLIDDFMTDFDQSKVEILLPLMQAASSQLIITSPLNESPLHAYLALQGAQVIELDGMFAE